MLSSTSKSKKKSIPFELNTRINHLSTLLKHLPTTLPLDPPESTYDFGLDDDDIKDEGLGYAFNRRMKIIFSTQGHTTSGQILFTERGKRLQALIGVFREMAKKLSEEDTKFYLERWMDRICAAAKAQGAKIPNKKRAISPDSDSNLAEISKRARQTTLQGLQSCQSAFLHDHIGKKISINLVTDDEDEQVNTKPITVEAPSKPKERQLVEQTELRQRTLFEVGAYRSTLAEAMDIQKKVTHRYGLDTQEIEEQKARKKALRELRKRNLNRARQQRFRDRKKLKSSISQKAKSILLGYDTHGSSSNVASTSLATISRPQGQSWKSKRNGKNNGVVQKVHSRVNWYHPFLWTHINKAAPRAGWSPHVMVLILRKEHPNLFSGIHKGTIHKWISKNNKRRWSTATIKNVNRRHALAGTGRVGVLTPYQDLVASINKTLTDLRTSGIIVDRLLARSIILAKIKNDKPKLLENFKCSESFVRQYLASSLNWSIRHGTRAAAHIPENAMELCERTVYRIVHLINYYDIIPELIIGMDQTGVNILMSKNTTYEKRGSKQVNIVGRDEKRAYTLCVASTPSGRILPFQQVWSGKTKASLRSANAEGMDEARELRFIFSVANSQKKSSHFSTLKTMKEWMEGILRPYIVDVIQEFGLDNDQKSILYIDCYPVHTGIEFRVYVLNEFPHIFLIFVPANCTGIFQPADVGLQRIAKHFIRQRNLEFLVNSHTAQIESGLTPDKVKITTSLPTLRDASVRPIVDLYDFFSSSSGRDIIRKAWEKCTVFDLNLGSECLTSKKTKATYREYIQSDAILREEIKNRMGQAQSQAMLKSIETEEIDEEEDDEVDDGNIPVEAVVRNELGVQIQAENWSYCVPAELVTEVDGRLQPEADEENIWAYRDDGSSWNDLLTS